MDEIAVLLNCTPNRSVHPTRERTVSIRAEGKSTAMIGTKLPVFSIT